MLAKEVAFARHSEGWRMGYKMIYEAIAEARIEGAYDKAIETARNFLSMGFSVEQVAQGTGLPIEKVEELV